MAKKYIDADRLKQTIADNVYPVQDAFNSRDYGMFWTGGIEKAIDEQPAVDIAPRWIPVAERLPEEDKEVLISYRYKEGEGDTSHVNIDITTYGQMHFGSRKIEGVKHWRAPFEYFESNYEVIAWMPLPSPYKGGEEE